MNRRQRIVLFIMAGSIILTFLFPPCLIYTRSGHRVASGYGFILDLPESYSGRGGLIYVVSTVNVPLLLAQIIGILVVGGIIWIALKEQKIEKVSNIVDELTEKRKPPEDRPKDNLSARLEELKAQKEKLERNISFEVDQIRRLELKEELKKIRDKIIQIERS